MTDFEKQWSQLNGVERASIEKRYAGKSYTKIAEELVEEFGDAGFKLSTLKNNFAEDGRLFEIYYWYAERTNNDRDKEATMYWRSMIMNAVAVVNDEMEEGRPNRLRAAQMVIESMWGKSVQPLEVTADVSLGNKYLNMKPDELRKRLVEIRAEKQRVLEQAGVERK